MRLTLLSKSLLYRGEGLGFGRRIRFWSVENLGNPLLMDLHVFKAIDLLADVCFAQVSYGGVHA